MTEPTWIPIAESPPPDGVAVWFRIEFGAENSLVVAGYLETIDNTLQMLNSGTGPQDAKVAHWKHIRDEDRCLTGLKPIPPQTLPSDRSADNTAALSDDSARHKAGTSHISAVTNMLREAVNLLEEFQRRQG